MVGENMRRRGVLAGLRSSFLTGLVVVLPVGLTIYLIWTVVGWIDGLILPLVPGPWQPDALLKRYLGPDSFVPLRGVGVVVFLIFTIIVGWAAKGLFGRSMIGEAEKLVERMPVVGRIYRSLKQIAETVFSQEGHNFQNACLVQYPRSGCWALGFVSTHAKGEVKAKLSAQGCNNVISVFVPTTPNPTSGFLLYLPENEVIYLDMNLEDAAKLVISAGLVYPGEKHAGGKPLMIEGCSGAEESTRKDT